jgi:hypothetical protein
MPPPIGVPNYPLLFKHMVLAIYRGKSLTGTPKQKLDDAFKIALSRLKEYGHAYEKSTEAQVLLTSKGVRQNGIHLKEEDKRAKTLLFDKLYLQLRAEDKERPSKQGGLPPNLEIDGKPVKKL